MEGTTVNFYRAKPGADAAFARSQRMSRVVSDMRLQVEEECYQGQLRRYEFRRAIQRDL
jgi:hypothetical protein